jgi:hypothetical protein
MQPVELLRRSDLLVRPTIVPLDLLDDLRQIAAPLQGCIPIEGVGLIV